MMLLRRTYLWTRCECVVTVELKFHRDHIKLSIFVNSVWSFPRASHIIHAFSSRDNLHMDYHLAVELQRGVFKFVSTRPKVCFVGKDSIIRNQILSLTGCTLFKQINLMV